MTETEEFLSELCFRIHRSEARAEEEELAKSFGDGLRNELFVMRIDKIKVEIRKENVNHHLPHMHISHSDKFDISISLTNFEVLAGDIGGSSLKALKRVLVPLAEKLNGIWIELNEKDNSIGAERLISNLFG